MIPQSPDSGERVAGTWKHLELAEESEMRRGAWFLVSEKNVVGLISGVAFAPQKTEMRPVVLTHGGLRPSYPVWPRSSGRMGDGVLHDAHPQSRPHGACAINEDGRVCAAIPYSVTDRQLVGALSCFEPEGSSLWSYLDGEVDL
jgi:hypothetical protein